MSIDLNVNQGYKHYVVRVQRFPCFYIFYSQQCLPILLSSPLGGTLTHYVCLIRLFVYVFACVCVFGCLFVCAFQNKEFVCRGHDYERLEAFQQRMLNEFPHAIAMQHANQPDQTIYQAEAQCILLPTCTQTNTTR